MSRFEALLTKDEPAQIVVQAFNLLWVAGSAQLLGELEEGFRLLPLRFDALFHEFHAQSTPLGDAIDLLSELARAG